jgi:nucleotide-binding universal stress UspA family protein
MIASCYVSIMINWMKSFCVDNQMGRVLIARTKCLLKKCKSGRVSAAREIVEGYPSDTIIRIAEKENMNLIVVGYVGASGLERFLLGSVADKVVRNSKVPVLVVR